MKPIRRNVCFLGDPRIQSATTILMCHMLGCWLINDGLNEGEIDCVFSEYVHEGKVIFPFISGLYARSLDGSLESCRASMI